MRVIAMPLSYAFFGLGLVGAVAGRERRTLHDVTAGSTEVYDWGGRSAELPTVLSIWLDLRTPNEPTSDVPARGRRRLNPSAGGRNSQEQSYDEFKGDRWRRAD